MNGSRILIVIAFLSLLIPSQSMGKLSSQETADLADEAGSLFRRANELAQTDAGKAQELYEQTILRYKKIIEEGRIANAGLYYNIGNAYLLKGDVGRAILNYRRAQQFPISDATLAGNLKKNLQSALEKRRDQVTVRTRRRVLHTLFFWHYDFGVKTRFILACCGWALALGAGSYRLWRRRGVMWLWLVVLGLVLLLGMGGSVAVDLHRAKTQRQGVIVVNEVVARQGDGDNYPVSFKEPLHSGTEFELKEQRTRWLRIELASGDEAWIPASAAEMI